MVYEKTVSNLRILTCVSDIFRENCYLVQNLESRQAHIVDPGDCLQLLYEQIERLAAEPQFVLLTHGHFDHIMASRAVSQKFGIPVYISSDDFKLLRRAPLYGFKILKKTIEIPEVSFFGTTPLSLGQQAIGVIPTPGHTQGSVCLDYGDVIFVGDTLFVNHIGPTNYPESSLPELFLSIERLLQFKKDETIIFSGHGRPWTVGEARSWFGKLDRSCAPQYLIMNDPSLQAKGMKS